MNPKPENLTNRHLTEMIENDAVKTAVSHMLISEGVYDNKAQFQAFVRILESCSTSCGYAKCKKQLANKISEEVLTVLNSMTKENKNGD